MHTTDDKQITIAATPPPRILATWDVVVCIFLEGDLV